MEQSSKNDDEKTELLRTLGNFKWLGSKTPCFPVMGNKVRVLTEPHSFYQTIVEKTSQASKRITFASLYLGTGSHEKDIVEALESTLKKNHDSNFKIRILLDATRGSRGAKNNSRTMLLPLVQSYNQQCSIHFYHTPALRGLLKKILPERWNEIVGLQHMKIYIFDDSLLISGANLSHDYFTNRQDRYLIIEDCKELVDFFDQLVETVCQFSFQMNENNNLYLNSNFPHHPYESNRLEFTAEAKRRIGDLFEKQLKSTTATSLFQWPNPESHDTWIFPFVQMGQLSIYMDNLLTRQILEKVPQNAELCLATGYFNLTQDYMNSLLEASQPNIHILMAHPLANGFFGARGFAGGIPSAYTLLAYQFYQRVLERAQAARIRLWEYQRQNWTFHAKGLWISFNRGDPRPCFTLVGSPNFGYRSVYRDLEAQLAVVTINSSLRDQLHQERKNLFQQAELVSGTTFDHPERKIPLWVRFVIKVFRRFF
nr:EOG090X08SX [Ceriodaphnia reticulata]